MLILLLMLSPLGAAAQPILPLIIYPSILYRKTDLMITEDSPVHQNQKKKKKNLLPLVRLNFTPGRKITMCLISRTVIFSYQHAATKQESRLVTFFFINFCMKLIWSNLTYWIISSLIQKKKKKLISSHCKLLFFFLLQFVFSLFLINTFLEYLWGVMDYNCPPALLHIFSSNWSNI